MGEPIGDQEVCLPRRRGPLVDSDDAVLVVLRDENLLGGIADLRWRLDDVLARGTWTVVIDVSDVRRLSSATVAVLLWATRRCQARNVRVVVREPTRASMELLRRTGLVDRVEVEYAGRAPRPRPHQASTATVLNVPGCERAPATARSFARRWCADRALPGQVEANVERLVGEVVAHALDFAPRSLPTGLGWRDPDHVRVEISWRRRANARARGLGLNGSARRLLKTLAKEWGYEGDHAVRRCWFVVDARVPQ